MPKLTQAEMDQLANEENFDDDDDSILDLNPEDYADDAPDPDPVRAQDEDEEDDEDDEEEQDDADEDEEGPDEEEESDDEGDEPEEDGEETDSADGEEDEDVAPAKAAKPKDEDHMVPKRRYDSAKERLNEALAQLRDLKKDERNSPSNQAAELDTELRDVSKQFSEAVATGDVDKANELSGKKDELIMKAARMQAQSDARMQLEEMRYADRVREVEELYPELDQDHEDFDKEISAEVVELCDAFEAKGYSPSAALDKAVNYVVRPNATETETVEPAPEAKKSERTQKAIRRNLQSKKRQPPSLKGKGKRADKQGMNAPLDFESMSDDDFDNLDWDSEEMKAQRGDYL